MSEQEQVGLLQPITSDGSSDASMCAIPLFRGANLLGRRHVAVPHACLSRRHLEAEVLDDGRGLKITVKGTNPAVVVSKSNRQRIDPNKSVILGSGEILELLPGKFPFRYVSSFSPSLSVAGQSRDFFFPETARTDREIRADSESFGDVRDRDDDERISKFGQSVERKELFRESNAVFSGGVEVDKRRVLGDTDWEEKSDMEDHRRQKRACLLQDKQKTNEVTIGEIKESGSRNEKEKEKEKTGMKKEITRSREMKPEITDVTEKHIETSIPLEEMFDLSRSSATFRLLRTQHVPWPANEGSVGINDVIQETGGYSVGNHLQLHGGHSMASLSLSKVGKSSSSGFSSRRKRIFRRRVEETKTSLLGPPLSSSPFALRHSPFKIFPFGFPYRN